MPDNPKQHEEINPTEEQEAALDRAWKDHPKGKIGNAILKPYSDQEAAENAAEERPEHAEEIMALADKPEELQKLIDKIDSLPLESKS